jgi:hypothetical protein
LIILAAAAFRISAYGDIRASVGTMDTQSYMAHAGALDRPKAVLLGERLLTTGLLYRLWGAQACELDYVSIPAIGKETSPGIQECFAGLASTQVALSLVGWSALIAAMASTLEHTFSKVAAAVMLSVFAFAPQLADWDSVLSSESLALSLFALGFGLGILALKVTTAMADPHRALRWRVLPIAGTIAVGVLWVLVRDAHVYVAMVMMAVLLAYSLAARPRRRALVIGAAIALVSCLLIQSASQASGRWKIPLTNAFSAYVLPFPERVRAIQRSGMPEPGSEAYEAWFARRAPGAYAFFLATHPGFVLTTLVEHMNTFFLENSQPYFKKPDLPLRDSAYAVGDLVHSKSVAVLTLDSILVSALLMAAARQRPSPRLPMALLLAGLFASALLSLVLAFFADAVGIERHVMLSVVLLRLLTWLGLALIVDMALGTGRPPAAGPPH